MKGLVDFISESLREIDEKRILDKDDVYVWNYIEVDDKSTPALEKSVKDNLERLKLEITCVLFDQIEKYNNDTETAFEANLKKAAEEAVKTTYRAWHKRTPEEFDKLLKAKTEEIIKRSNSDWYKNYYRLGGVHGSKKEPIVLKEPKKDRDKELVYLTDNFYIYVEFDIHSEHMRRQIRWEEDKYDYMASEIVSCFPKGEDLEHLKAFAFYSGDKKVKAFSGINICFIFDDEWEDKLSKQVQKFADFMTREYASGRYMGD